MRYLHRPNVKNALLVTALSIIGAVALSAQDHSDCPMMAKKDHRAEVDQRHDAVSGVSHEGAVHHFLLTADGGTIRLETTDASRIEDRDRIRHHLQVVARSFAAGDFALPMEVHAQVPPGVSTMQKLKKAIAYDFSPTERGGEVRLSTHDASALSAIHAFLRFQIEDHGTGDPIE